MKVLRQHLPMKYFEGIPYFGTFFAKKSFQRAKIRGSSDCQNSSLALFLIHAVSRIGAGRALTPLIEFQAAMEAP